MAASRQGSAGRSLTFRVENIPYGTTKEELRNCFYGDDKKYVEVKSLVPSVDVPELEQGELTATVHFYPNEPSGQPPRLTDDSLEIDKDFYGFTPLHVPQKVPILADIIAVTGLAGHAYGSWAHSSEHMWLRDYLPKDINARKARILTYGYDSKLQGDVSVSLLGDYANTFARNLINMRAAGECESRPIIFVGHSLGCLIIKKALIDTQELGLNTSRLPVRSIIFLGAPHGGLNIDALRTLVKGEGAEGLVEELKIRSPTLSDLNRKFGRVARDINILSCYETKPTKSVIKVNGEWRREGDPIMMVEVDSAQTFLHLEESVSVNANHSQLAKIHRGQGGILPTIVSAIRNGLLSNATIVANTDAISQNIQAAH